MKCYCVKCKKPSESSKGSIVSVKGPHGDRKMYKGTCDKCSGKVCKFVKSSAK